MSQFNNNNNNNNQKSPESPLSLTRSFTKVPQMKNHSFFSSFSSSSANTDTKEQSHSMMDTTCNSHLGQEFLDDMDNTDFPRERVQPDTLYSRQAQSIFDGITGTTVKTGFPTHINVNITDRKNNKESDEEENGDNDEIDEEENGDNDVNDNEENQNNQDAIKDNRRDKFVSETKKMLEKIFIGQANLEEFKEKSCTLYKKLNQLMRRFCAVPGLLHMEKRLTQVMDKKTYEDTLNAWNQNLPSIPVAVLILRDVYPESTFHLIMKNLAHSKTPSNTPVNVVIEEIQNSLPSEMLGDCHELTMNIFDANFTKLDKYENILIGMEAFLKTPRTLNQANYCMIYSFFRKIMQNKLLTSFQYIMLMEDVVPESPTHLAMKGLTWPVVKDIVNADCNSVSLYSPKK